MGMPSFVLCVHGESKIGKSTALLLAGSFNGIGEEKLLPNLNTSVAAFQETARNFSGLLVPANETALLEIGKKNLGEQLTELVYKFAEGVEKARHSKSTFVAPEGGSDWDGALVITSEYSLTELASVAGIERKGGEQARAIDVPARLTKSATICDSFPKDLPVKKRKEWARKNLLKIREGCAEHHGVMLDLYGPYLIAKRDQVKLETKAFMDEFLAELDLSSASEAMHHAALCCALIFAGGMQGIEAEVLPFKKKRLKEAVLACCRAALNITRDDTTLRERGRDQLVSKLEEAYPKGGPKNPNFAGLKRFKRDGKTRYAIPSDDFIKWFPNRTEAYAALLWLHEMGKLVIVEGAVPKPGKFTWAITWPKFKGKGKRRIVFRDPRKAKA